MPRIETFASDRSVQVGAPGARADVGAAGSAGAGLASIGEAVANVGQSFADRYIEAKRQSDAANIAADASSKLNDAQFQWSKTPDMTTAMTGFDGAAAQIRQDALSRTSDPIVQNYVAQHVDQQAVLRRGDTRTAAFGLESSARRGELDLRLQTYSQQAASATNEALRRQIIDTADSDIRGSIDAGWIHPEQGIQRTIGLRSKIDEVKVRGLMTADPDLALQALADPRMLPNLDEKTRAQMFDTASRRSIAQEDRLQRDADKQLKKIEDDTGKTAGAMAADGTLTRKWLDDNRGKLSKADYTGWLAGLNSGADKQKDNPDTIADLEPKMDDGDIRNEITLAFKNKDLSVTTYRSMMARNASARKDDAPSSPFRSGRDVVKTKLDPGQLLSGAAANVARAGQADALVEFDNWAGENPQAKRSDAQAAAQAIVKRYQVIAYDQMSLATGLPQFFTGTRTSISIEGLDAAAVETVKRFDAGKISKETADLEARKLETWRHILSSRPAPEKK